MYSECTELWKNVFPVTDMYLIPKIITVVILILLTLTLCAHILNIKTLFD